MELITVTFTKWHEWNPRKDYKSPFWFAMSNRITEDDEIQTLGDKEFRAFIHMFCLASQNNSETVSVNLSKAERVTGIKREVFLSTIEKLVSFHVCRRSDGNPTESDGDPTESDLTEQDITIHNNTGKVAAAEFGPKELAELWNEKVSSAKSLSPLRNTFPRVNLKTFKSHTERYKSTKARIEENPSREYWIQVIERILKSDGCCGKNDRGWLADFDFLVRQETHIKALEGKYDVWGKEAPGKTSQPATIRYKPAESVIAEMGSAPELTDDERAEAARKVREMIAKTGNLGASQERKIS